MADDERPESDDPFASLDISSDGEDADWGEDWESAFQAEDDMFFSDGEEDFFIEEDEQAATPKDASSEQKLSDSLEQSLDSIPDDGVSPGVSFTLPAFMGNVFVFLSASLGPLLSRVQALPLHFRIPAYAVPVILLLVIISFFTGGEKPLPPELQQAQSISVEEGAVTPKVTSVIEDEGPIEQTMPEKVRKKWTFASFLIPVDAQEKDKPVTFVMVDITLVTALDSEEDPPGEKKTFMRDVIYQFYTNRPLHELRHFSLARGEMNRKLRAWIQKQWPEAPIESIIFNRYHLT